MHLTLPVVCSCFENQTWSSTLQEEWLPDIKERNIPHSSDIDPLDMLTDDSTKVGRKEK